MAQLIQTIKDHCHECYSCVRNCPVKAVKVRNGQAEVIAERCIHCANCVSICSQGAKKVRDEKDKVKELIAKSEKVVAGLAPSFPAFNRDWSLGDWQKLLEKIGFYEVYEVAFGAELIIDKYKELLSKKEEMIISTSCPVVVRYVEKYYPELVTYLAPIVSPMAALARYIKKAVDKDTDLVLIGPCQAKKAEFQAESAVNAVLTFSEMIEMIDSELVTNKEEVFYEKSINTKQLVKINMKNKISLDNGRQMPLSGGLKEAVTEVRGQSDEFIQVEGVQKISSLFNSIISGDIQPSFVDVLFCDGCISGVDLLDKDFFQKEKAVEYFIKNNPAVENKVCYDKKIAGELDLSTSFKRDFKELPVPEEEDIWAILNKTNKYNKKDLLNCGACGYNSCRDKAVAVYQGLAEVEMCLPYLLAEKRSEIVEVQRLNNELDNLINSSYDGMILINGRGVIERVNDAYQQMVGRDKERLLGQNVAELEEKQVIYPSVALLSLNEQRNITLVQNTARGKSILATANPIISENGQLQRVIVNARDINELDSLLSSKEKEKLKNYLNDEKEQSFKANSDPAHIISQSQQMKEIIRLAERISNTGSTVLITGESGVGKEVIARYIHQKSNNRDDFVKINCAAIPETLLESELFGYETGAFSGARQEGKSGLIEKADNGTLFLDEIGEIPLKMQAKLLQVIQEHRVTRIGGTKEIPVDFRLITATNRDLEKMIQDKEFREDLYYRLNVVPIRVPPLRKRREDIGPLIDYFIQKFNKEHGKTVRFTSQTRKIFEDYYWPGNIRELINVLERIIVTSEEEIINYNYIKNFFPENNDSRDEIEINQIMPIKKAVAEVEKKLLQMAREKGKSTYEMAEMLKVNQSTIVRKLNKYFNS